MIIFKIIGATGLLLISTGIITKTRKTQDILYILGGLSLKVYSIYLGDIIFIILQIVFILAAGYDLMRIQVNNTKQKNNQSRKIQTPKVKP